MGTKTTKHGCYLRRIDSMCGLLFHFLIHTTSVESAFLHPLVSKSLAPPKIRAVSSLASLEKLTLWIEFTPKSAPCATKLSIHEPAEAQVTPNGLHLLGFSQKNARLLAAIELASQACRRFMESFLASYCLNYLDDHILTRRKLLSHSDLG